MVCKAVVFLLIAAAAAGASAEGVAASGDAGATDDMQGDDVQGIKKLLWANINSQLHSPNFQWLNAIIMLIFGKFMVWNGQVSFKLVVASMSALVTCIVALSQIHITWEDQLGWTLSHIVGLEFGALAFWVVWAGFAAVQYGVGLLIGYLLSQWLTTKVAYHIGTACAENQWFVLINWNVCIIVCLWLFHEKTKLNKIVLTVVSSFFGGAFISACLGYFTMFLATFWHNTLGKMGVVVDVNQAGPRGGFWIDYLTCIFDSSSKDVGLFQNSSDKHHVDCILGRVTWMFFFGAGLFIAYKIHPLFDKEAKPPAKPKPEAPKPKEPKEKKGMFGSFRRGKLPGNEKSYPLLG